MRSLILAMLRDMQEERMPFTFLMPARESLYRPYDFRYIYDQPRWVLKYNPHIHREPCNLKTLGADLAEWQTAWLKRQYEVFAIRDEAYLQRMEKELASENGPAHMLYDDDWFIGMQSEWGLKEREMRLSLHRRTLPERGGTEAGDHGAYRLHAGVRKDDPAGGELSAG